jgi:predicted molibdopterin-dependent oxidoreductase YjgC
MIAPKKIAVTIDGKRCEGTLGQTILQIATESQIYIPTLCYLKHLSPWGGCRMCIVEIAGSSKVAPACSTPATDDSTVTTNTDRLKHLRRMTLELLFSERNHICPFCPMNRGDCELQMQGYRHSIDAISFPYLYPALPVDLSGRYFGLDHNRCILCTRCVRTCEEQEGVHTLDIANRGANNRVVVDLNDSFGTSDTCTLCGACVAACPTGALFDKAQAFRGKLNTCKVVRTTCTECPVGCGLLVFTKENRIVEVFGDHDSPVSRGHLCARGRYETWAEPRQRILQPMIRRDGALQPVSWDEALKAVRDATRQSQEWQNALLVSPRVTNETAKVIRQIGGKFERVAMFVGKNEAALCASPDLAADAMQKLHDADAIIVLGAQPSRDNGVVAAKIRTTVRRRGAKLLIFHARKSDLDQYADVCANVVSLERSFWKRVTDTLKDVKRPALVYGPGAMTPIGVTVLERLIGVFEKKRSGQAPQLIPLPVSSNGLALAVAGVEPLEDIAGWLDVQPLNYLHIIASDEPDGGARLLHEKHVRELLAQIDCVVVQASYESPLLDAAKIVLPAAIWCEKSGTVTNFEGHESPLRAVLPPRGEAREDKAILEALSA